MDNKAPAFQFVNLTESIRRARVDNGWIYQVETGRSTSPERPKKPWTPSGKLDADQAKQHEDELDAHDKKMSAWTTTIYWSQPTFAPDSQNYAIAKLDGEMDNLKQRVAHAVAQANKAAETTDEIAAERAKLKARIEQFAEPVRFDSSSRTIPFDNVRPIAQTIPRDVSYVTGRLDETTGSYARRSIRRRVFDAFRAFVLELY